MDQAEGLVSERRVRRWRSVAEKRRIVELTFVPGASVALVARAHGVNANQVFKWRGEFERGELSEPVLASASLLPVPPLAGLFLPATPPLRRPHDNAPTSNRRHIVPNSR